MLSVYRIQGWIWKEMGKGCENEPNIMYDILRELLKIFN